MATITIMDPVTRIEGHMKVEVTIDTVGGVQKITDARCTGTLFRGFETILAGRNPHDATVITPRICGVCPVSHGVASVKVLESAANFRPPANARILRNLVQGANFLQSHILSFYLLSALDYAPGPAAQPFQSAWNVDIRGGLDQVTMNFGKALEARRRAHEMGAVFGGRMPSASSYVPGGFTATPTTTRVSRFRQHLLWLTDFIRNVYLPDVQAVAAVYSDYFQIGAGCGNLLSFGVFDLNDTYTSTLLKRGVAANRSTVPAALDLAKITEQVKYSWYNSATTNLNPSVGAVQPVYPKTGAYSWLKAPRLSGKPYEAGPLARMWVNGDYRSGISVMDRQLARAQETLKIALAMNGWLDQLQSGASVYTKYSCPSNGSGVGLTEAPRGALGHWLKVSTQKVANYQVVTPTCWNASPRDDLGVPGPMEQALIGTPVKDATRPVEALRVIHSFDPCLSCAVHVMRPEGKEVQVVHAGVR